MAKIKKPSDFKNFPCSSVLQKSESETVAQNIMVILARTGNTFRPLSWKEYKTERLKDGNFSEGEKGFFKQVTKWCKSAESAQLFSKEWAEVR